MRLNSRKRVGNDVVDVKQARKESNWKRKGFIEKLFTPEEQEIIASHHNHEMIIWVLWSMKEAAYKIYARQTLVRAFIPLKLNCCITYQATTVFKGTVQCQGYIYYTQTIIDSEIIYTNSATELAVLQNITEIFTDTIYKDNFGFPYIYDSKKTVPVSVSHHGAARQVVK